MGGKLDRKNLAVIRRSNNKWPTAAVGLAGVFVWASGALATTSGGKINDQGQQYIGGGNGNYYSQPSAGGTPITVLQNGFGVGLGLYYPHSFTGVFGGYLEDTQFYNLVSGDLKSGNKSWVQDSLIIQLGPCFSGGFIDEFDNGGAQNMAIGTASWWGGTSTAVESPMTKNFYNTQTLPWINALNTGKTLIDAYATAAGENPFSTRDLPQYFSSSDAMDGAKPGVAANGGQLQKKYALVFVGSVKDKDLGDWNDSVTEINSLLAKGYPAGNISFYFADYAAGKAPSDANAYLLPDGVAVKGPGSTENMTTFFDNVKPNATGAQVVAFIGGHGGLDNEFKGLAQLTLTRNDKGNLQFNFQAGLAALAAYAANPDGNATVRINAGGITGMTANDRLDVLLKDPQGRMFDLGTIMSDGNPNDAWLIDVPSADLLAIAQDEKLAGDMNGDLQVEFANYSFLADPDPTDPAAAAFAGDYSNVVINDFSLLFSADVTVAPEPGSLGLLAMGAGLLLWRRRSSHRATVT